MANRSSQVSQCATNWLHTDCPPRPGAAMIATASIDSIASKARSSFSPGGAAGSLLLILATKQRVPPFLKNPYTACVRARCPGCSGLPEAPGGGITLGSSAENEPNRLVYSLKLVHSLVSHSVARTLNGVNTYGLSTVAVVHSSDSSDDPAGSPAGGVLPPRRSRRR